MGKFNPLDKWLNSERLKRISENNHKNSGKRTDVKFDKETKEDDGDDNDISVSDEE
jgi:hypothetical protein